MPLPCVIALEIGLAGIAPPGGWMRAQALQLDFVRTIHANAVFPPRQAQQRRVDFPDFPDVKVDDRKIEVNQQVRNGLFFQVMDLARQVDVVLFIGVEQLLPNFLAQCAESILEYLLEFAQVFLAQHGYDPSCGVC